MWATAFPTISYPGNYLGESGGLGIGSVSVSDFEGEISSGTGVFDSGEGSGEDEGGRLFSPVRDLRILVGPKTKVHSGSFNWPLSLTSSALERGENGIEQASGALERANFGKEREIVGIEEILTVSVESSFLSVNLNLSAIDDVISQFEITDGVIELKLGEIEQ
ncbi:MAG: hypothetical protein J6386_22890 [Candidatus Synoicihabitans palmerolidicus]|nr:hypothetical protein [Candidatus Synoicihabitans palmerolidicus]